MGEGEARMRRTHAAPRRCGCGARAWGEDLEGRPTCWSCLSGQVETNPDADPGVLDGPGVTHSAAASASAILWTTLVAVVLLVAVVVKGGVEC